MAPKKGAKRQTPWDIAKPILRESYLDGRVTDDMKPRYVWELRPEFQAVKYKNFSSNFYRLKRTIRANKDRADKDQAGYLHDMNIYKLAKDSDGFWDGSPAQRLLKADIEQKRNKLMKPKSLWLSRQEYQEFNLEKFRGHLHQELRSKRETNYWIVKKRKKKKAAEARRNGEAVNDEDMDFLYDPVLDM